MRVLLLVAALVLGLSQAFCITRTGYYLASKALAVGIGFVTTHAACRYTNDTSVNMNDDCPPQCALLIRATWGDCYCSATNFSPQVGDPPINSFTTYQIFSFLAYPTPTAAQANCRTWMNTPSSIASWQCSGNVTATAQKSVKIVQ